MNSFNELPTLMSGGLKDFNELLTLSNSGLKRVLDEITDNKKISIMLLSAKYEVCQRILNSMSEERRVEFEQVRNKVRVAKLSEIRCVQEEFVKNANQILNLEN